MFLFRLGFWVLGCGTWILPIRSCFWKFYSLVSGLLYLKCFDHGYQIPYHSQTQASAELLSTDLILHSFQDRFLRPDDSYEVVGELARLTEQRASAGLGTGATSDKSQSWVNLHMSIADKRILNIVAGNHQLSVI